MPSLKLPRLTTWILITVALLLAIAWISPHQLPVVLYKSALVTQGAVLGYWIDRTLFTSRPHDMELGTTRSLAELRRAAIVLACILGLTLGL